MKKIVVLTGAGISAESGIRTFRETNGLWEEHDIMDVASPIGWEKNPEVVMDFYNQRRKQLKECSPNNAHYGLVELEKHFDVEIITQNIDNLHEQAGSKKVLHLHGELTKVRSLGDPNLIYELDGWELNIGDKCEKGFQLRPHIVWFGEDVPEMDNAIKITNKADILVVIGTSLNVYPAAGLINHAPSNAEIYLIDPNDISHYNGVEYIKEKATLGIEILKKKLEKYYK